MVTIMNRPWVRVNPLRDDDKTFYPNYFGDQCRACLCGRPNGGCGRLSWAVCVFCGALPVSFNYAVCTIFLLSFVGVCSLHNLITDCAIAADFGVFGLILKWLNLPIVPTILGMVLSGIMEVKFRCSTLCVTTPWDMIDRPVAKLTFLVIIYVITYNILRIIRGHKNKKLI